MLWSGSQLALVHVGDTRAYLLRGGELFQITHDHTVVQSLIDQGQLTPEEALSHPERALLLRALDGTQAAVPDLSLHDVRAGDRYLLCSDGLTSGGARRRHPPGPARSRGEPAAAVAAADRPGQLRRRPGQHRLRGRRHRRRRRRTLVTNRLVGGPAQGRGRMSLPGRAPAPGRPPEGC